MYYAVIENNIVVNVIVADETFVQTYEQNNPTQQCVPYDEVNEDDTFVARIGEGYIDGKFVNGNQAVALGLLTAEEALIFGFHSGHEYTPPPKVESITKVQTMRVLKVHNLWDTFNAILASSPDAMDEWSLAIAVERNNPFVIQLAPLLGLTETQMDDLFVEASTL